MEQATELTWFVASGPYTTEDNLDFSPFQALLDTAAEAHVDVLVLTGPFIDIEHPLVRTGDFDLPANYPVSPDKATVTDLFRYHISRPLAVLAAQLPKIQIILMPAIRDAVSKHGAWPQDRLARKDVGLPKAAQFVTSPATLSVNETVVGASSLDVLDHLRAAELAGGRARADNVLARLTRHLVLQRHFYPVFPPPLPMRPAEDGRLAEGEAFAPLGPSLDVAYLQLGEWLNVRPDVLISPSVLPPFAKVVESVVAVNPGTLMKRKGAGTYARLTVKPMTVESASEKEREQGLLGHRLWERCRVDIVRI